MGSRHRATRAEWTRSFTSEPAHGAFVIRRQTELLAQMTYSVGGAMAIIDHTDVDEKLRGTGTGARLVRAAVDWARAEKMQIVPLCPFARSVFDKTPEFGDVLKK